jgi:very-short-patch-repair endonuclease
VTRKNDDKAQEFYYYWNLFAPVTELDRPTPEYEFAHSVHYINKRGNDATRKYAFDWAWPSYRVAVEVDGGQWCPGGGRHAEDTDREKTNIAASLRWLVFHFSPDQLKRDPEACIKLVLVAIMDSI